MIPYLGLSSLPRTLQPKTAFNPSIFCCSSTPDFLQVKGVCFRPPGTEVNLLDHVTFGLPEKSLGLIYGRSGSGKTTLLQVLAGLAKPSEGYVTMGRQVENEAAQGSSHGKPGIVFQFPERQVENEAAQGSSHGKPGIVFQFPERFFLADTIIEELTFGLSIRSQNAFMGHQLHLQLHQVALAVGLTGIPWDANPRSLSDGYKRRLALAVQLVRKPRLLLLDEPLAGLDWKARADVAKILASLKQEISLIVVSHDLKELTPFVDKAWRMDPGGRLTEACVPL